MPTKCWVVVCQAVQTAGLMHSLTTIVCSFNVSITIYRKVKSLHNGVSWGQNWFCWSYINWLYDKKNKFIYVCQGQLIASSPRISLFCENNDSYYILRLFSTGLRRMWTGHKNVNFRGRWWSVAFLLAFVLYADLTFRFAAPEGLDFSIRVPVFTPHILEYMNYGGFECCIPLRGHPSIVIPYWRFLKLTMNGCLFGVSWVVLGS